MLTLQLVLTLMKFGVLNCSDEASAGALASVAAAAAVAAAAPESSEEEVDHEAMRLERKKVLRKKLLKKVTSAALKASSDSDNSNSFGLLSTTKTPAAGSRSGSTTKQEAAKNRLRTKAVKVRIFLNSGSFGIVWDHLELLWAGCQLK